MTKICHVDKFKYLYMNVFTKQKIMKLIMYKILFGNKYFHK